MVKLAIDADSLAYRLGSQTVVDHHFSVFEADPEASEGGFIGEVYEDIIKEDMGEGDFVECSLGLAKEVLQLAIDEICAEAGTTDYTLYVTTGTLVDRARAVKGLDSLQGKPNFRYAVAEKDLEHGYKHNRKSLVPMAGIVAIMYSMLYDYNAHIAEGCEADDIVCALGRERGYTIAALDKDVVYQSSCKVLNYNLMEFIETTPEQALHYKFLQAIMGDAGDGYKGVPKVGKVKANKLIEVGMTELEMFQIALQAYEDAGLGLPECLATMRLADMHQLQFIGDTDEYFIQLYTPPEGAEL